MKQGVLTIWCVTFLLITVSISFSQEYDKITFTTASETGGLHFFQQKLIYSDLFARLGRDFELIHQPAKRSILDVNSGTYDGDAARIFDLNKNNPYPDIIRVDESVMNMELVAFTTKSTIKINGWQSLKSKSYITGHSRGYKIIESNLPKYIDKKQIVIVTDIEQGLKMLKAGRLDIFIDILGFEETIFQKTDEFKNSGIKSAGVLEVLVLYPYINKKHQALIPQIIKALQAMKNDGTHENLLNLASKTIKMKRK